MSRKYAQKWRRRWLQYWWDRGSDTLLRHELIFTMQFNKTAVATIIKLANSSGGKGSEGCKESFRR